MLLAREFVHYISRQLVKHLTPGTIETPHPDAVAEKISEVITDWHEITAAPAFYRAEEYHQRYLEKHGRASCAVTVRR